MQPTHPINRLAHAPLRVIGTAHVADDHVHRVVACELTRVVRGLFDAVLVDVHHGDARAGVDESESHDAAHADVAARAGHDSDLAFERSRCHLPSPVAFAALG